MKSLVDGGSTEENWASFETALEAETLSIDVGNSYSIPAGVNVPTPLAFSVSRKKEVDADDWQEFKTDDCCDTVLVEQATNSFHFQSLSTQVLTSCFKDTRKDANEPNELKTDFYNLRYDIG